MTQSPLLFHPLTLSDKDLVQRYTLTGSNRNCDLCFVNLWGWRFLYETEVTEWNDALLFRFKADGHWAYLFPLGTDRLDEVLLAMQHDAETHGHAFLMLGVNEQSLAEIHKALPGHFRASTDRAYSDYLYLRERFRTLSGKKMQSKRNFVNRFKRSYPDYQLLPLTKEMIPLCLDLDKKWSEAKETATETSRYTYAAEREAMKRVFAAWDELGACGLVLRVGEEVVAYTYGGPINNETFDVCVEKADTRYEGAYAMISHAFAASLPSQYRYINREEDLGIEGLRLSKLSYHPECLLDKYSVITQ